MVKSVREPIQVYLTPEERADLDRAAEAMGVSRSEALRRAVDAIRYSGVLRALADDGYVTPPSAGPGSPPPSAPVAPIRELLIELAEDRGGR
jgi:hypothetical protein